MSQKVNARDAIFQLNDRIVKQKNYITFLQQQLDEKNIEYKKILEQNEELKQKIQLEIYYKKENRFVHFQNEEKEENKIVKEEEPVKNGISFKISEINNDLHSNNVNNVNKKPKINFDFNDLNSFKGLTLGDLINK